MNVIDTQSWSELDRSIYLRLAQGYVDTKFPV